MGCAPSIHVSGSTGIANGDSISNSSADGQFSQSVMKNSTSLLNIPKYQNFKPNSRSAEIPLLQAENLSGIQDFLVDSKSITHSAPYIEAKCNSNASQCTIMPQMVDQKSELQLGPMKVYKQAMEILFVFGADDPQLNAFVAAAKRGNYKYKLQYNSESAMEYYLSYMPELVMIDIRVNTSFDGEALCRHMRATRPNFNTVIVAVTKKLEQDDISIAPLLNAGFSKRFVEDHSITACYNELLSLDYGEVSLQCKLRATSCLFSAVEHAYDSIEIQCIDTDKVEFQYVNPAYEKVTGYWRSEVVGNMKNHILLNCDVPKPDSHESILKLLSNGKSWEGVCIARKKCGEQFVQNLKIVPMVGHTGSITHYVVVKRDLTAVQHDSQVQQLHQELSKVNFDKVHEKRNNSLQTPLQTSIMNSVSTKAEAPITKEILRTTELYTPTTIEQVEGRTGFGTDLVEGLMWNFRERRHSAENPVKGSNLLNSHKVLQVMQASPDIQAALQGEDQWDYDVIKLEKVSNNRPLYYLGQAIFNRFDVGEYLCVSDSIVRNWLQLVEANYHIHNTYHNSTHAADVLHATSIFLLKDGVKNTLDRSDQVAALIAAVVHDVDHPGFTNSFLCNAGSELAILYNDIAILESHHAAMAFKLTSRDSKSNIFQNLKQDEFKLLRQSIIDMIMATEMKQHFEHLAKFDNSFNKRHATPVYDHDNLSTNGRGTPESVSSINLQSPENRGVVRRMIIKCADIANPARPLELCREWAYRIAEEYFRQTEEEKKRNLPIVMPVFDRNTCNVPKSQVFFIDYFVMNLYVAWDKFAQVSDAMEFLRQNLSYWHDEAERLELEKENGSKNSP
ncbi:high affinity cAMP-specific and IBMX-insensitive 3',5'-cyclic phosphodiesterase 8A isoform X2 [Hydra vulgaris]|uniref:high affinity cAMP-specific and IBMX-insensitive 3',5'-cyclic phosphodiesterase 8A isoform X2 n=2 Tax=Hydra vulgaris TaxID=6087 RepID=UPI0006413672|nr:high affinity cAMP-specific and IBMX-insensitive 3',5'-cyclic phosphodiesterase 8A isoform X2 [Hydra vulgaris]